MAVSCPDVAATRAVAAALVPLLRAGDAVLLVGGLGAGKTAFTQGLAAAAGVVDPVTSPTFTLMRPYATAIGLDLLHVDVYRLEDTAAIANLGLAELLEEEAFAVVEWGERAVPVIGPDHLEIRLARPGPAGPGGQQPGPAGPGGQQPGGDDHRELELRSGAPSWIARWDALAAAVAAAPGVALLSGSSKP